MGLETIRAMQQEARKRAAENNTVPYIVDENDIVAWSRGEGFPLPFPFIGDYEPEGFTPEGDNLFVDTSGFGADDEPSLSMRQLIPLLEADKAYAFTSVGQFQGYLQKFTIDDFSKFGRK